MRWFRSAHVRPQEVSVARRRRWPLYLLLAILLFLIVYTFVGFFGAPYGVRRYLTGPLAARLHRPVTVGRIAFNPYKLRLEVDDLQVASRQMHQPLIKLKHILIRVSWSSLRQRAPVIGELDANGLVVNVERTGEQTFNFSDLVSQPSPPSAPKQPYYFSISNIQLDDGTINFNDEVLAQQHKIDHLQLAIPFIANLPADTEIYVRPYLQMVIDGSPFSLNGKSKPFGPTQASDLELVLHNLDLPRYFAYLPTKLPLKLPKGTFSTVLQVHFQSPDSHPHVSIEGSAALDTLELRDASDAPLLSLGHARVDFTNVEPLEDSVHLKRILIDSLNTNLTENADGTTNLTPLFEITETRSSAPEVAPSTKASPAPSTGATASPVASPVAGTVNSSKAAPSMTPGSLPSASPSPLPSPTLPSPSPATAPTQPSFAPGLQYAAPSAPTMPSAAPPQAKPALDLTVDSFELTNSSANVTDRRLPTPGVVALNGIHAKVNDLQTLGDTPAPFTLNANLASGGAIAADGNLRLKQRQVMTKASLTAIDLAALKEFIQPYLNGTLASGKLSATATTQTDFTPGKTDVHIEPANLTFANFDLRAADGKETPLAFGKLTVAVKQVDLASRRAVLETVRASDLKLLVREGRSRRLNLLELPRVGPVVAPPEKAVSEAAKAVTRHTKHAPGAPTAPASNKWQYQIASVVLDKAEVRAIDDRAAKPVEVDAVPLQLEIKGVSSDFAKPAGISLQTTINRKGLLKIDGTAAPEPLNAKLHIETQRLDLTPVNAYLSDRLNVKLASLLLTMNGVVDASRPPEGMRATYRGNIVFGNARFLDKLTGDNFVRWNSLSTTGIVAEYGGRKPRVRIGGIALSKFYSRIILETTGRLNFKDTMSSPHEPRPSLTRPQENSRSADANTSGGPARPFPVDLEIGGVTLTAGHINYTDNFIKPHYSADLNDVGGKISAFGTGSTEPAAVAVSGLVNQNAPLKITGLINPLIPLSSVDLTGKADGIELPPLSPYSTKYTGYPIVKGTLKVDVHYVLKDQQLTAANHISIDQLTFGNQVESKGILNLPIRLAVALLKNPQGVINLDIPVSGSLNNPEFSVTGAIAAVVENLITKAVTAPFTILADTVSGVAGVVGSGGAAELKFIEFKPGFPDTTADSQKRLDVIAKALTEKPVLQLDITGVVDPQFDIDGLRQAKLDHEVLVQKLRSLGIVSAGNVTVSKDDYDKYLEQAYKAANFEKPRNFLGMLKSLPPNEMEKLMIAHETVNTDDLKKLADGRANAVRKTLNKKGISLSRLFVVASVLNNQDSKDSATSVLGAKLSLK